MGRSLTAVAGLLEATGRTEEAEATYRKAETLLVELAPTIAEAAAARAVLADCRSQSRLAAPHARAATTKPCRSTAWRVRTRRRWPPPPGRRPSPGGTWRPRSTGSPFCWQTTGKSSEAEAEFRKALAIHQKLADDNPAVTDSAAAWRPATTTSASCCRIRASHRKRRPSTARRWRSIRSWPTTIPPSPIPQQPGEQPHQPRLAVVEYGQVIGSGGRVPQGAGDPAEAGRRQSRRHRIPQPPGAQPQQPRHPAVGYGQVIGSGGRVPQGAGDPAEAGRRQPRHPPVSEGSGGQPAQHRLAARAGRKNGRGDRLLHAGRGDPAEARRGQLGNPRRQGLPGELPDQHGGRAPSVGEA